MRIYIVADYGEHGLENGTVVSSLEKVREHLNKWYSDYVDRENILHDYMKELNKPQIPNGSIIQGSGGWGSPQVYVMELDDEWKNLT